MKPIIVNADWYLNLLASGQRAKGTVIFPFIVLRSGMWGEEKEVKLRHEKIHFEQVKELWVVGFYLLYAYFWLKNKAQGFSNYDAYVEIPFEREAFQFEDYVDYEKLRNKFSWKRYLNE